MLFLLDDSNLYILHYIFDDVVLSPKHQLNKLIVYCSRCHIVFPPFDFLSISDLEILLFHHQGYKRSKSNCYSNCTLLKIDGVRTKVSAGPLHL